MWINGLIYLYFIKKVDLWTTNVLTIQQMLTYFNIGFIISEIIRF